jgi:peptide/nickel transport system substrate-binding protein
MEALRSDWIYAANAQDRAGIARSMQLKAIADVPFWPLGQYLQPTAHRKSITGLSSGFATFWNVRPA